MEKCFWRNVQLDTNLACLNPSLLPEEVNFTKPECQDFDSESQHLDVLRKAYDNHRLLEDCNCPKRCKVADYHIFVDPSPACQEVFEDSTDSGYTWLTISFPSKRVCPLSALEASIKFINRNKISRWFPFPHHLRHFLVEQSIPLMAFPNSARLRYKGTWEGKSSQVRLRHCTLRVLYASAIFVSLDPSFPVYNIYPFSFCLSCNDRIS